MERHFFSVFLHLFGILCLSLEYRGDAGRGRLRSFERRESAVGELPFDLVDWVFFSFIVNLLEL